MDESKLMRIRCHGRSCMFWRSNFRNGGSTQFSGNLRFRRKRWRCRNTTLFINGCNQRFITTSALFVRNGESFICSGFFDGTDDVILANGNDVVFFCSTAVPSLPLICPISTTLFGVVDYEF